jgi:hypothetical protein
MATEIDRLIVVYDANAKRMEEKLDKVIRSNQSAAKKVEDAWSGGTLSGEFGELADALTSTASKIPVVGGALGRLGQTSLVAAASVGALAVAFVGASKAMEFGADLAATAKALGIGTEALQELEFAAGEADVPVDALHTSLKALNGTLGAMKSGVGDKRVKEAFAFLRITDADLKGMRTAADLLPVIADRLQRVGTYAEQVQITKKLGIEALLPMLKDGSAGLEAMAAEARALGLVLDDALVQKLATAQRQMDVATQVIKTNLIPIFAGLAVEMGKVAQQITELIKWWNELQKKHEAVWKWLDEHDPADLGRMTGNLARRAAGLPPVRGPARSHAPGPATVLDPNWVDPRTVLTAIPKAAADKAKKLELIPIEVLDLDEAWAKFDAEQRKRDIFEPTKQLRDPLSAAGLRTPEEIFKPYLDALVDMQIETEASLYDGIRGGLEAGFRDGLPGVLRYLQDALTRSVLDSVAEGLTDVVLRNQSSGAGGLLTAVASALFGRSYAGGTMSARAGIALVGERGPELVKLPGGSRVIPNSALNNVGMGGGRGVTQTLIFDNRGAVIWEQAARQMMAYADRAAVSAGGAAVQSARRATPDDLARSGSRRLGR